MIYELVIDTNKLINLGLQEVKDKHALYYLGQYSLKLGKQATGLHIDGLGLFFQFSLIFINIFHALALFFTNINRYIKGN